MDHPRKGILLEEWYNWTWSDSTEVDILNCARHGTGAVRPMAIKCVEICYYYRHCPRSISRRGNKRVSVNPSVCLSPSIASSSGGRRVCCLARGVCSIYQSIAGSPAAGAQQQMRLVSAKGPGLTQPLDLRPYGVILICLLLSLLLFLPSVACDPEG